VLGKLHVEATPEDILVQRVRVGLHGGIHRRVGLDCTEACAGAV
jgi:hypothetical protein